MSSRTNLKLADISEASKKIFALDAILLPHPNKEGQKVRVGRDQRGAFWKFEQVGHTWHAVAECTDAEAEEVTKYGSTSMNNRHYDYRQGPSAGWVLLYHITEPP